VCVGVALKLGTFSLLSALMTSVAFSPPFPTTLHSSFVLNTVKAPESIWYVAAKKAASPGRPMIAPTARLRRYAGEQFSPPSAPPPLAFTTAAESAGESSTVKTTTGCPTTSGEFDGVTLGLPLALELSVERTVMTVPVLVAL
jgi:hypothetical protein